MRLSWVLSAAIVLSGCGSAPEIDPKKLFGEDCQSSSECRDGLECLAEGDWFLVDTCDSFSSTCSRSCDVDADCEGLDGAPQCLEDCDGGHYCARTEEAPMIAPLMLALATLAAEHPKLAVLPLASTRIDRDTVATLDDLLVGGVHALGRYQTVGPGDINAILGLERMKSAAGCDDISCAAEVGGALGVQYLVTGRASILGNELVLSATLIDISKTTVVNRAQLRVPAREEAYADAISQVVQRLFGAAPPEVAAAPPVSATSSEAQAKYNDAFLGLEDMAAIAADTGNVVARWSEVYRGKYKQRIEVPEFYDLVGQTERADQMRSDTRLSTALMWGGLTVALAGSGVMLGELRTWERSEDRDVAYCSEVDNGRCTTSGLDFVTLESKQNHPNYFVIGGVLSGIGLTATLTSYFFRPERAAPDLERRWVDDYNTKLKQDLGVSQNASPRPSLAVAPYLLPDGAGVGATLSY